MTAWHYTTVRAATFIIMAGQINTSPREPEPGEVPAAWFSLHPLWEVTAAKRVLAAGYNSLTTMDQLHRLCGLVRLGADADHLATWDDYLRVAGPGRAEALAAGDRRMAAEIGWARAHGPALWRLSFNPFPTERITKVQVWDGRKWGDV